MLAEPGFTEYTVLMPVLKQVERYRQKLIDGLVRRK